MKTALYLKATEKIFGKMPDGSRPDYNRIYDAADRVFAGKKIEDKALERFLYQYADAVRNHEAVLDREAYAKELSYDLRRFIKDPTGRIEERIEREKEIPELNFIRELSEAELEEARRAVEALICGIGDEQQKLIMYAHYICGVDWKYISEVFGHQDRWAKDKHTEAIKKLKKTGKSGAFMGRIRTSKESGDKNADTSGSYEIESEILEARWKYMEFDWRIEERSKPGIPDDIKLVFGV